MGKHKAVFLDRDNTLIHNDGDLGDPARVRLIRGAVSAIASLRALGFKVVVVSNQGGVARGAFTEQDVNLVNQRIAELVQCNAGARIDRFYYCPYHPKGTVERYCREHPWRKPNPGMLQQAARDLNLDLDQCWTVGDQPRDVQAGLAVGTRTVLLRPTNGGDPPHEAWPWSAASAVFFAHNLIEAARLIEEDRQPAPPQAPPGEVVVAVTEPPRPAAGAKQKATRLAAKASTASATQATEPRAKTESQHEPADTPTAGNDAAASAAPSLGETASTVDLDGTDAKAPGATTAEPTEQVEGGLDESVADGGGHDDQVAVEAADATDASDPSDAPDAPGSAPGSAPVLRQILQELRQHRPLTDTFSFASVMAVVLQLIAIVCLVAGLLIGQEDTDLFLRWLGSGVIVQLAVIAALLFRR